MPWEKDLHRDCKKKVVYIHSSECLELFLKQSGILEINALQYSGCDYGIYAFPVHGVSKAFNDKKLLMSTTPNKAKILFLFNQILS